MERLLADASKIAGVQFNIDSYSDVIQAIHVMQESMGIAGTTAEEAEHTISGSINMLSASWNNFLTGLMDENADIGALGEQLLHSVGTVIQNVAPRIMTLIGRIISDLPQALVSALQSIPSLLAPVIVQVFGEQMGGQINDALGGAFGTLGETFMKLGESIMSYMQTLWVTIEPAVMAIADIIATVIPIIMDVVNGLFTFLAEEVYPFLEEVFAAIAPAVEAIAADIQTHMPEIQAVIETVMGAIKSLIETVWPIIKDVVINAVRAISQIIQTVWPIISQIISAAMAVIKGIIDTTWPAIKTIIETVMHAIQGIMNAAWSAIEGIVTTAANVIRGAIEGISAVVSVVQGIFDGVRRAIEDPLGAARDFVRGIIDAIIGFFNFNIEWPHIPLPHFEVWGSPNPLDWLQGDTPGFSIEWYAKGGIVDGATLIGAGEAGPEMILPQQGALMDSFASTIAQKVGGGVDIHDCTFVVREESDIRRVASELYTLMNRQMAGGVA